MKWSKGKPAAFALLVMLGGLSVSATAADQPAAASTAAKGVDAWGNSVREDEIYCPSALEQILPGEYYACEARSAYGRQKYKHSVDMLQEAAYWANKAAQYSLGLTYFEGNPDVPANRPLGLAWLALSAERKNQEYSLMYAAARARSTPAEVQQAVALWQKMRLKYGDEVAAPRAIRYFNHAMESIDEAAAEGGTVYLRGFAPAPENAVTIAQQLHDVAAESFGTYKGTVTVERPQWLAAKAEKVKEAKAENPASSSSTGSTH